MVLRPYLISHTRQKKNHILKSGDYIHVKTLLYHDLKNGYPL